MITRYIPTQVKRLQQYIEVIFIRIRYNGMASTNFNSLFNHIHEVISACLIISRLPKCENESNIASFYLPSRESKDLQAWH